jgi:hypothetical protein
LPADVAEVSDGGQRHPRTLSRERRGRPLALPRETVTALQALREESKPQPGELVFWTTAGQRLDAANVRRSFRAVCRGRGEELFGEPTP